MKRTDFTLQGGFPLSQDRLKEMQDTYFEGINALTALAGNNCIVSGCAENGTNVAAGWVVINGELLPFKGGTKNTYLAKKETVSGTLQYADGNNKNAVFEKETVFTASSAGAVKWADMKRISDLKTVTDSLKTVTEKTQNYVVCAGVVTKSLPKAGATAGMWGMGIDVPVDITGCSISIMYRLVDFEGGYAFRNFFIELRELYSAQQISFSFRSDNTPVSMTKDWAVEFSYIVVKS